MKLAVRVAALGTGLAIVLGASQALALPMFGSSALKSTAREAGSMRDGGATPAQVAFNRFCERYPGQCASDGRPPVVELDAQRMAELRSVNAEINRRIVADGGNRGLDDWSLDATVGHCNEYAVQKRSALIDRGWPVGALSLAVASTRYDVGNIKHLVLVVRTDRGDYVLDNLASDVVAWKSTGYRFLMRQSTLHPRLWVRVDGSSRRSRVGHHWRERREIKA